MNKTNTPESSTPGVETPKLTQELIVKYLNRDLSVAISCLTAIQSDPDLMESLATFMLGRVQNSQRHN